MIVSTGETYELVLYKRIENSPYQYEQNPTCIFKGRPANQVEVKNYRLQQGVNTNTDSTYLYVSNLPHEVKPGDRIVFLGKIWTVNSTGFYFDSARITNASIFTPKQIEERCPKGISIQ